MVPAGAVSAPFEHPNSIEQAYESPAQRLYLSNLWTTLPSTGRRTASRPSRAVKRHRTERSRPQCLGVPGPTGPRGRTGAHQHATSGRGQVVAMCRVERRRGTGSRPSSVFRHGQVWRILGRHDMPGEGEAGHIDSPVPHGRAPDRLRLRALARGRPLAPGVSESPADEEARPAPASWTARSPTSSRTISPGSNASLPTTSGPAGGLHLRRRTCSIPGALDRVPQHPASPSSTRRHSAA